MRRTNFVTNNLVKRQYLAIEKILRKNTVWLPYAVNARGRTVDGATLYRIKSFEGFRDDGKHHFKVETCANPKWWKNNQWQNDTWEVTENFIRYEFPKLYKKIFFVEILKIETGFEKRNLFRSFTFLGVGSGVFAIIVDLLSHSLGHFWWVIPCSIFNVILYIRARRNQ